MNPEKIQKLQELFKDETSMRSALRHMENFDQDVEWRGFADARIVLPRPFDAYLKFFKFNNSDFENLKKETQLRDRPVVLDVGGGCSDFAQKMQRKGIGVISADPMFFLDRESMLYGIRQLDFEAAMEKLRVRDEEFKKIRAGMLPENVTLSVQPVFAGIRDHIHRGLKALEEFVKGFSEDVETGMYAAAETPDLPFKDEAFELVIASHFVFSGFNPDMETCLKTMNECMRVGKELRIFPTISERFLRKFNFFDDVLEDFRKRNHRVEIYETDYELYPEKRFGLTIRRA